MILAERSEETEILTGLLDEAKQGRGSTVLVTGPLASGKSVLLDVFAEQARAVETVVLSASASEEESGLQLGVLGQLARRAPLGSAQDRVADILAGAAGLSTESDTDQQMAAAQNLAALLLDLCERQPIAVAVDDVHHADSASLHGLAYLVRRLRNTRTLAVFAHSDAAPYRHHPFRLELLRKPFIRNMPLTPLSREAVETVAADRIGRTRAAAVAEHCAAASGGNPLLVGALLDDYCAEPTVATGAELTADGYYGQAVLACLHRGGARTLDIARALAVLGAPDDVHRLLGLHAEDVAQILRSLDASGVLDAGRFRHPAARAAVLTDLDPARRAELHSLAAQLRHATGGNPRVVAEHLIGAGRADSAWALGALEEAGLQAMTHGDNKSAVVYLKLAHAGCTDESDLVRIKTLLLRAKWQLDPSSSHQLVDDLTQAMRGGRLRGADALVLIRALLWNGNYEAAQEVLTYLRDSRPASHAGLAAGLRITRSWIRCTFSPFADGFPAPAFDAGADQTPSVSARRLEEAVNVLSAVLTEGPSNRAVQRAERMLRSIRLDETGMDIAECALLTLVFGEETGHGAELCDALVDDARACRAPTHLARLLALRADIAVRQGDMPGAERYAREALSTLPLGTWGVAVGYPMASLLTALTAMGKDDEALEQLARPVPDAMMASRYGLHYLQARGQCELATGDAEAALRDFRYCGELMVKWGMDIPGLISWRNDAAEACLRLSRREEARDLVEQQLVRSGKHQPRTYGRSLRLLALSSELPKRPALLRQATDLLQTAGDRYELARALTDLAGACEELGEYRRARVIGRHGWDAAQGCRAQGLLNLLSVYLGRPNPDVDGAVTGRDGGGAVLSSAERRVVEQASLGLTNREISARLYITVSTVEQHLTRAYRKLNVSSRSELPITLSNVLGSMRCATRAAPPAAAG